MLHHDLEDLVVRFRDWRENGSACERPLDVRMWALQFEKDLVFACWRVRDAEESWLPPNERSTNNIIRQGNIVRVPDWRFQLRRQGCKAAEDPDGDASGEPDGEESS